MFIINFCVGLARKAGHHTSAFFLPSSTPQDTTESAALVDEAQTEYQAIENVAEEDLGLTGSYESWLDSDSAFLNIFGYVLVFFVIAVVGFSFVFEDWPVTDSIYFAVVIFTTVGYGDFSPTNGASRVFTIFVALFGIIILGILLGIVGEFILDRQEERLEERKKNVRHKVMEQFSEDDTAAPPPNRTFLHDAWDILLSELPIILVLCVLGTPIIYLEQWDWVTGLYWMFITGTTVGFGDMDPTTTATRMMAVVFIPLSVAVFGEFLGRVAGAYIERRNDAVEDRFLSRAMTLGDLRRMDINDDGVVSPDEFLRYMLVALQKVEEEDIDEIMDLFKKLDKSNTGSINKADLKAQYRLDIKPGVSVLADQQVQQSGS